MVEDLFGDESFFLSRTNPTATVDQRDTEALAIELLESPAMLETRAMAARRMVVNAGYDSPPPAEALEGLEEKVKEFCLHFLMYALNSDSNYPKVIGHGFGPPHEWFGMRVPGTRGPGTGENPDNNYSTVPIDNHSRFELHGKVSDPRITDVPMFLCSNATLSGNVAWLDWRDVEVKPDGTFVVTIDDQPADGRPNHLMTAVDVNWLLVRDCRMNWDEIPNAYRIKRLDPPTAPPRPVEELLAAARRMIADELPPAYWVRAMIGYHPPNAISPPINSSTSMGMATQQMLTGRLSLADDEAFVITLTAGGSTYWTFTLYDWWFMTGNYWSRTACMNNTQAIANPDGSYTLVCSIRDPGVHNWLDTNGLHENLIMHRWQMMPTVPDATGQLVAAGDPTATGTLVKLADLKDVLPDGTKWVTTDERIHQLSTRLASFNRRYEV